METSPGSSSDRPATAAPNQGGLVLLVERTRIRSRPCHLSLLKSQQHLWPYVRRRVTYSLKTGDKLADESIDGAPNHVLYRPLPEPQPVRVEFWGVPPPASTPPAVSACGRRRPAVVAGVDSDGEDIPAMPTIISVAAKVHRPRLNVENLPLFGAVARPVSKAEIRTSQPAQAALQTMGSIARGWLLG